MGVLNITASQLAEVQRLKTTGASVTAIWKQLADYGDSYAAAAAQVTGQPGTLAWTMVRAVWDSSGADFSKFNAVATSHSKLSAVLAASWKSV